jgi:putative endonuclease
LFEKPRFNPNSKTASAGGSHRAKKSANTEPRSKTSLEDPRRTLGAIGESRAASFLARRGYRIDARNVRYDGVEIDLIARRGCVVVFVEVKTRRSSRFGTPELAVDRRKQARMIRAAHAWLHQNRTFVRTVRFDVISCTVERSGGGEHWQINHWVDAFDASD